MARVLELPGITNKYHLLLEPVFFRLLKLTSTCGAAGNASAGDTGDELGSIMMAGKERRVWECLGDKWLR